MSNPTRIRILPDNEDLLYESEADYIGGLSEKEKEIAGQLVLTSSRLSFEYLEGGLFSKRAENLVNYKIPDIIEVKIDKTGFIGKKYLFRISVNDQDGEIVRLSFKIGDEHVHCWRDAIGGVLRKGG